MNLTYTEAEDYLTLLAHHSLTRLTPEYFSIRNDGIFIDRSRGFIFKDRINLTDPEVLRYPIHCVSFAFNDNKINDEVFTKLRPLDSINDVGFQSTIMIETNGVVEFKYMNPNHIDLPYKVSIYIKNAFFKSDWKILKYADTMVTFSDCYSPNLIHCSDSVESIDIGNIKEQFKLNKLPNSLKHIHISNIRKCPKDILLIFTFPDIKFEVGINRNEILELVYDNRKGSIYDIAAALIENGYEEYASL